MGVFFIIYYLICFSKRCEYIIFTQIKNEYFWDTCSLPNRSPPLHFRGVFHKFLLFKIQSTKQAVIYAAEVWRQLPVTLRREGFKASVALFLVPPSQESLCLSLCGLFRNRPWCSSPLLSSQPVRMAAVRTLRKLCQHYQHQVCKLHTSASRLVPPPAPKSELIWLYLIPL